ncbi:MAG: Omp28-related outer membrane protein [Terrimonas sp.]|nr:Omp28-related outer membrane protein [Terrimonas sp.]
MKQLLFAGFFFLLISCTKKRQADPVDVLQVTVNSSRIYADGIDELRIRVTDIDSNDITASSTVYIDGTPLNGYIFTTNTAKEYTVKAVSGGAGSAPVYFRAVVASSNRFSKKIVVEEFAGTWCGYCPATTRKVDSLHNAFQNIIPVQVHNGDPLQYMYEPQMRNRFGISSFPAVYLERSLVWDGMPSSIQTALHKIAKCGLALFSAINGNQISLEVRVKFDITTSVPLRLVVVLLEDSVVSPQVNLYNNTPGSPFFNAGNPIPDYTHNNVLRKSATDIFGDAIPVEAAVKDSVYSRSFGVDASGLNLATLKLAAYVIFAENTGSRFGVLNAQLVHAGLHQDFD